MATSLLWEVIAKCLEGKKFASHTSVYTGSCCPDSYILDHWTLFDTASQYLSNSGSKVFFGARTYVFRFSKYGTYFKVTSTVWNHFCAANNRISTHLWVYFECFHRVFHSDTTFSIFDISIANIFQSNWIQLVLIVINRDSYHVGSQHMSPATYFHSIWKLDEGVYYFDTTF